MTHPGFNLGCVDLTKQVSWSMFGVKSNKQDRRPAWRRIPWEGEESKDLGGRV
jgi:hypothetical protein